jgi:antirestriction protein ArdC
MLWSAAIERVYAAPIWMTYRQAAELMFARAIARS